jgi:butyrate kinase
LWREIRNFERKKLKIMTDEQKIIAEGFQISAKDLGSHKKAIDRLQLNQEAQQKKLLEFAEVLKAPWSPIPARHATGAGDASEQSARSLGF